MATVSIDALPVVLHGIALGPAVVIRDYVFLVKGVSAALFIMGTI